MFLATGESSETGRSTTAVSRRLSALCRLAVENAATAGGERDASINARIAADVIEPAELMLIVVDANPRRAGIVGTEESGGRGDLAEELKRGFVTAGCAFAEAEWSTLRRQREWR